MIMLTLQQQQQQKPPLVCTTPEDTPEHAACLVVLLKAVSHFTITLLSNNIHSLVASYEHEARKKVLSAFYIAHAILVKYNVEATPKLPTPSLLSEALSGHASVFTLFGGQGVNEFYIDELQALFDTYRPFVEPFLHSTANKILQPLVSASQDTSFYEHGPNIISWLTGATPRTPIAYFASVPVSFPLIGLTQFTQFLVTARMSGLLPAELSARLSGASGHSQGLVTTIAIPSSKDGTSFLENTQRSLRWLFFAGLRGQQFFPVLALEPRIRLKVERASLRSMLSVQGLILEYLPEYSQLSVSLHNRPRTFIVTGRPRAVYVLVTNLRKIHAPNGADQSKVEFSKRKPVFSARFLVVGVSCHSQHLRDAMDKIVNDVLHGEELWTPEGLHIPVYHTEDGKSTKRLFFIRHSSTSY
jgi:fatty acid synthase subunit alpha, fungi type